MKRLILAVCLLLVLASCTNIIGQEETTMENSAIVSESEFESGIKSEKTTDENDSTESTAERQPEEVIEECTQRPYPSILDRDPDLDAVDYSKFVFIDGLPFPINDLSVNAPVNEVQACIADMVNSIKDHNGDGLTVSDHEEAVMLIEQFVTSQEIEGYSLMVLVCYDAVESSDNSGLYYVNTKYSEVFEYKYSIAKYGVEEPIDVLMFIQKELELFNTPENLMTAIEKYTKYSKVTKIIICAAKE